MDTTPRAIRIDDALWADALAATTKRGETISDVVRDALRAYVKAVGAVSLALVALFVLSGCGSSPDAATAPQASTSAAVQPVSSPAVSEPVSTPTATCWSDEHGPGAWRDQYNQIADPSQAVKILDALPTASDGCTQADQTALANAHDLAAQIHGAEAP